MSKKRTIRRPQALADTGLKVALGIPLERNITDAAFLCFWEIARRGWALIPQGYGRTDLNRNELARRFLESDCTHLVMLDTDHLHPPDTVERLLRWVAADPTKQVVAGLHFRRGEPFEPMMYVQAEDGSLHAPLEWPQGLVRMDACGHGTLLVAREVLETIPGPWWQYDYSKWTRDKPTLPTEDLFFCARCREYGIKLWCDTTQTSPHLITSAVNEQTYQSWVAAHPAAEGVEADGH